MASCKNCRKTFSAKNALFCSTSCYKFYTDALERNVPSEKQNRDDIFCDKKDAWRVHHVKTYCDTEQGNDVSYDSIQLLQDN
jgi:hypothetical protein